MKYAAVTDEAIWGTGTTIEAAESNAESWAYANMAPDEREPLNLRYVEITDEEYEDISENGYLDRHWRIINRAPVYSDEHGPHPYGYHVAYEIVVRDTNGEWANDCTGSDNRFPTEAEAREAIVALQQLGEDWAEAEYDVRQIEED